jgi:hypothetical protein
LQAAAAINQNNPTDTFARPFLVLDYSKALSAAQTTVGTNKPTQFQAVWNFPMANSQPLAAWYPANIRQAHSPP